MRFLKKLRGQKKEQFVVLFLIGLLLMVIVWPSGSTQEDADAQDETAQESADTTQALCATEEYAAYLEERLEDCLAAMDGVGEAEVFVTLKSSSEEVLAKDKSSTITQSDGQDETGSGSDRVLQDSQTSEETVYADTQDGQSPYVVKELMPVVRGVLVVAEGGDDAVIQQNICEAIEALFSIESHKIKIVKRKTETP